MICIDCSHVIIRVLSYAGGEEFFYCDIDGMKVTTPVTGCSRYVKEVVAGGGQEEREEVEERQEGGKEVESFKCNVCGKEFGSKIAMVGHMRSHK